MRRLACVCTGVWNGVTIRRERVYIPSCGREAWNRSVPLPLSLFLFPNRSPPPHARWPRAVSPDIMVHTRIRGITRLPPSPLYALSRSTFYCSLPIEHCAIATVIIPRCKRHNLVTVSPGISFSNDTAFIMREVRRPRSFPRIIIDRYRQS